MLAFDWNQTNQIQCPNPWANPPAHHNQRNSTHRQSLTHLQPSFPSPFPASAVLLFWCPASSFPFFPLHFEYCRCNLINLAEMHTNNYNRQTKYFCMLPFKEEGSFQVKQTFFLISRNPFFCQSPYSLIQITQTKLLAEILQPNFWQILFWEEKAN